MNSSVAQEANGGSEYARARMPHQAGREPEARVAAPYTFTPYRYTPHDHVLHYGLMTYPDHHAREMAKWAHHRLNTERKLSEETERQALARSPVQRAKYESCSSASSNSAIAAGSSTTSPSSTSS